MARHDATAKGYKRNPTGQFDEGTFAHHEANEHRHSFVFNKNYERVFIGGRSYHAMGSLRTSPE